MEPWKQAVARFQNELTDKEKAVFVNAQPEDILKDVSRLEETQRKSSKTRQVFTKIKPLLDTVNDYGKAMDVFANSSSVLSPLWGSLRVLLATAQHYNDYYAKLVYTLERIGDLLPRYSTFAKLLQFHAPLQQAIQEAQIQMMLFFIGAKTVLAKSSFRMIFKSIKGSFDSDFEDCISQMRRYKELVEAESHTASIILQIQENQKAEEERQHAENSRKRVERLETITDEHCRDEAKAWLNARTCSEEKANLEESRLNGSCDWILRREQVSEWMLQPDIQVLWVHGAPGCGKSFLYSKLLNHLETQQPAIYFLFCGGDKERVTISSLLRSWCAQLLELFPQLLQHLETARNTHKTPFATDSNITELFRLLLLKAPTAVYLTVDALDECDDGDQFFKRLAFIPARFKILITSRTPANIRKDLAKIKVPLRTVEVEPDLSRPDIQNYIEAQLEEADFSYNEATLSKIRIRLADCDGMFLWVKLMIEHLQSQTCEFEVLHCLQELPEGLPQTYQRILERIDQLPPSRRLLAYKIFLWGLTVRRPVSVAEMRLLLAIQPKSDLFDETRLISDADCDSVIFTVSGGLLQLRGPEKKIYFTHFTVTEYLQENVLQGNLFQEILASYDARELRTNESLAAGVCLRYLSYDFVGRLQIPKKPEDVTQLLSEEDTKRTLLPYVITQWSKHLHAVDSDEPLVTQLALRFLDHDRPNLDVCWHLYWFSALDSSVSLRCPSKFSGLHIAAYFGLSRLVPLLLPTHPPSTLDSAGRSPLWWAASKGNPEIAKVLIEANFDPDEPDKYETAPVHRVAANGHTEVLEVILSLTQSSDNLVTDSEGWTPLHWAAARNQKSILGILRQNQDNYGRYGRRSSQCNLGRTPLHLAALNGHSTVFDKLSPTYTRKAGLLDIQDVQGYTALHLAALQGHQNVVEILLTCKADCTILDKSGKTAAQKAKDMGNDHIVSLLEIAAQYKKHLNPNQIEETVKGIKRHEINPSAFSRRYERKACPDEDEELNSLDTQDTSAMQAIINGHQSTLQLYEHKGRPLPIRRTDNRGRTMLHHSTALGYDATVRDIIRVLNKGQISHRRISPAVREEFLNRQDHRGWTALHYSAAGHYPRICRTLLINGVSSQTTNKDSHTAYDLAVREGHPETIEMIARHTSLPSKQIASDFSFDVLHIAARDGTLTEDDLKAVAIEQLQATDGLGRTPLYRATEMGRTSSVELLLRKITLTLSETLNMALLAEERQGNEDLVRFYLNRLEPDCLQRDTSLQLLAQKLLTSIIKRDDVQAAAALCNAGVSLTNCVYLSDSKLEASHALIIAIQEKASQVATMFIRRGADISATNRRGASTLYLAIEEGLVSVVECLLAHGADPRPIYENTPDTMPLDQTVRKFRYSEEETWSAALQIARLLLKYGTSLLTVSPGEDHNIAWTAINNRVQAWQSGVQWPQIQQLLIDHDCAMLSEEPDEQGWVSIHHAVASNDTETLEAQLDARVPVDWKSFSYPTQTPLVIAVENRSFEAGRLLIEYGADVSSITDPECYYWGFKKIAPMYQDFIERLVES